MASSWRSACTRHYRPGHRNIYTAVRFIACSDRTLPSGTTPFFPLSRSRENWNIFLAKPGRFYCPIRSSFSLNNCSLLSRRDASRGPMWTRCYRDFVMAMLDDLAASCFLLKDCTLLCAVFGQKVSWYIRQIWRNCCWREIWQLLGDFSIFTANATYFVVIVFLIRYNGDGRRRNVAISQRRRSVEFGISTFWIARSSHVRRASRLRRKKSQMNKSRIWKKLQANATATGWYRFISTP